MPQKITANQLNEQITAVAAEALAAGDIVELYSNGGILTARKASGATATPRPAYGFVTAAVASSATATVRFSGFVTRTGLTVGQTVYLSTTVAGGVQAARPTGVGEISQYLGIAVSTTQFWFEADEADAPITASATDPLALGTTSALVFDGVTVGSTVPSTPTSGVKIYAIKRASRTMIGFIAPSGRSERIQTFLGTNSRVEYSGNINATTFTSYNITMTANVGSLSATNIAATNYMTRQRRVGISTSAAANSYMEMQSAQPIATREGGFHFVMRFGIIAISLAANAQRHFFGLSSATTAWTTTETWSNLNIVGVGKNLADTTWAVIMNDGTTNGVRTTLTNTGTPVVNDFYQIELFTKAADTGYGYRVEKLNTGAIDEGFVSTDIPVANTILHPRLWMASVTATAAGIGFQQFYLDQD